MSISAISRRYAKALVTLGAEQKMVERFGEELAKVSSVLSTEKSLRLIMESPSLAIEKKEAILAKLTGAMEISGGVKNFLGLLLSKGRLKFLPQIEVNYRNFADEISGVLRAHIVSASKLNQAQQKAIGSGLEAKTGKKVVVTVDVDKSLIGGLQAEVGGKVFDGSIKTQLKRIEDTLKKG